MFNESVVLLDEKELAWISSLNDNIRLRYNPDMCDYIQLQIDLKLAIAEEICLTTIKSDYPCAYYVPHDYFMGQPFWKVMTQVATGYLYKYDIWDFLINVNGRKTEQDIPILPTSFKRDRRKSWIIDLMQGYDVGILGFYNNDM